jgi:hypothetical protein
MGRIQAMEATAAMEATQAIPAMEAMGSGEFLRFFVIIDKFELFHK